MTAMINLYKPVDADLLSKIIASGWQRFYPECEGQKLFYPKLHFDYAQAVARQRFQGQHGGGFVVGFAVAEDFLSSYPMQTIAYEQQQEYRIPVAHLDHLNLAITGRIQLLQACGINMIA